MKRRVVIAGWGQVTQGKEQKDSLLDPLGLMGKAVRQAAEAAGGIDLLRRLDAVMVVRVLSRHYPDAAAELSRDIGAAPRLKRVSGIGGSSPQVLINQAAGMIARGELDSVLIAGGEAYYPRSEADVPEGNALFKGLSGGHQREDMIGSTDSEARHGVSLPVHGFPLFEVAFWGESGLELPAYLARVGDRWAGFSRAAAGHPNAWTRKPLTAQEIVTPSRDNRRVAFPYTKFMNSLVTVDMGAAVLLMSEDQARRMRPKAKRPVFFRGGAYTEDRQRFLIQKSSFVSSPPLREAVSRALQRANLTLDEVECFDLYSCFPCSVNMACRMLGLEADPRPLTLTGGLGFFGGPGNNYSLHAVATLAEKIAAGERETGLVTGLGWFMHKHSAGIYAAEPGPGALGSHDLQDEKNPFAGEAPVEEAGKAAGKGVVETYTVFYSRNGRPASAVIYGRTEQGLRFVAREAPDPGVFELLAGECQVGRRVRLRHDAERGLNFAEFCG